MTFQVTLPRPSPGKDPQMKIATVSDLISALCDCDPNLPVGIACSHHTTPGDDLIRLPIAIEQHDDNQVVLLPGKEGGLHLLIAENDTIQQFDGGSTITVAEAHGATIHTGTRHTLRYCANCGLIEPILGPSYRHFTDFEHRCGVDFSDETNHDWQFASAIYLTVDNEA